MADSVLTRIIDEIKLRLLVSFDSGEVVVVREGRPVNTESATVVVQQMAVMPAPTHNRMGNPPAIGYAVPIHIHQFIQIDAASGETEEEYSARCNTAAADIVELITEPPSTTWENMGGNALLTRIGPMKYLPTDAGVRPGITVPLVVSYRVSDNDHTEARN